MAAAWTGSSSKRVFLVRAGLVLSSFCLLQAEDVPALPRDALEEEHYAGSSARWLTQSEPDSSSPGRMNLPGQESPTVPTSPGSEGVPHRPFGRPTQPVLTTPRIFVNLSKDLKSYDSKSLQYAIGAIDTSQSFAEAKAIDKVPDIPRNSACTPEEKLLCPNLRDSGGQAVARCLQKQLMEARTQKARIMPVSAVCQRELEKFFMLLATLSSNEHDLFKIEPVLGMKAKCKTDAKRVCESMTGLRLLQCLQTKKHLLSPDCKAKVKESELVTVKNPLLDVPFYVACKAELWQPGKRGHYPCGALPKTEWQSCLEVMASHGNVSLQCAEQLLEKNKAESEDVRLDIGLWSGCTTELHTLCSGVEYGEARMIKCLWDNTLNPSFTAVCRKQVLDFAEKHLKDYRLDYRIRTRCAKAIEKQCAKEKEYVDKMAAVNLFRDHEKNDEKHSRSVIECLKRRYRMQEMSRDASSTAEVSVLDPECSEEVKRVVQMHSIHPMADAIVARSCDEPIQAFCKNAMLMKPERIQKCLRHKLKHPSKGAQFPHNCEAAVVLQEALEARSIDLKPLMRLKCEGFISENCQGKDTGRGEVIACLEDNVHSEQMHQECKQLVLDDMAATSNDYRLKYGISRQCKADIDTHCEAQKYTGNEPVLGCLQENYKEVSEGCQEELRRYSRDNDANTTQVMAAECGSDVEYFCQGMSPGSGSIRECLLREAWRADLEQQGGESTMNYYLSPQCKRSLEKWTKHEAQVAMDARMSNAVSSSCQDVVVQLCASVKPGDGNIWRCLEDNIANKAMTKPCKEVVDERIKLSNFAYSMAGPQVLSSCKEDAQEICKDFYKEDMYTDLGMSAQLMSCMMNNRRKVSNVECATALLRKAVQRVHDIRSDPQAEQNCQEDIYRHCFHVEGYGTGMMTCLKQNMAVLGEECRAWLMGVRVQKSQSFALNPEMSAACTPSAHKFCKGYKSDNSTVIECLLDHLHDSGMPIQCSMALVLEEEKRASDIHFNPALEKACKPDLLDLQKVKKCPQSAGRGDLNGGKLINCLVTNRKDVRRSLCKMVLYRTMKHHSDDVRATPMMKELCDKDIKLRCKGIGFGKGYVHDCLRKNVNKLSNGCKELVRQVEASEGEDARLNPGVRAHCKNEMSMFCPKVKPGKAELLTCLDMHKDRDAFSMGCRKRLNKVTINADMMKAAKDKLVGDVSVIAQDLKAFVDAQTGSFGKWGLIALAAAVSWCTISLAVLCGVIFARQMRGGLAPRKVERADRL